MSSDDYMNRASWVDVRDVSKAHVLAIQKEEAGGQRILVNTGNWKWQDWSTYIHVFAQELLLMSCVC